MSSLYVFYKNNPVGKLTKKEDATLTFNYYGSLITNKETFRKHNVEKPESGYQFL